MANNPTLDVLTELEELKHALRATGQEDEAKKTNLKIVVSCGTGEALFTNINSFKIKDMEFNLSLNNNSLLQG